MLVTIALTGQHTEAVLMESLLRGMELHPEPVQPLMQVTALGGEHGYRIAVPESEVAAARAALAEHGFENCLSS